MGSATRQDENDAVRDMVQRLVLVYGSVDAATVEAVVRDACEVFREARIRSFVPILAERRARAVLDAGPPTVPGNPPTVPGNPPTVPGTPATPGTPTVPTAPREGPVAAVP